MKKFLIILVWYLSCNLALVSSFIALYSISRTRGGNDLLSKVDKEMSSKNTYQMYAALPSVLDQFTQAIKTGDSRPVIIADYLRKRNKALGPEYADYIVEISDHYEVDPYLIVAIAECESNLGEKVPHGSNNPFGYGIPTGAQSGTEFITWKHAIEAEVKLIRKYYDKGLRTPEEIGPVYAPPSVEKGGSWAKCVRFFLDKLK